MVISAATVSLAVLDAMATKDALRIVVVIHLGLVRYVGSVKTTVEIPVNKFALHYVCARRVKKFKQIPQLLAILVVVAIVGIHAETLGWIQTPVVDATVMRHVSITIYPSEPVEAK